MHHGRMGKAGRGCGALVQGRQRPCAAGILMGAQGSQFYADNTAKRSCPHAYCLAKSDK